MALSVQLKLLEEVWYIIIIINHPRINITITVMASLHRCWVFMVFNAEQKNHHYPPVKAPLLKVNPIRSLCLTPWSPCVSTAFFWINPFKFTMWFPLQSPSYYLAELEKPELTSAHLIIYPTGWGPQSIALSCHISEAEFYGYGRYGGFLNWGYPQIIHFNRIFPNENHQQTSLRGHPPLPYN